LSRQRLQGKNDGGTILTSNKAFFIEGFGEVVCDRSSFGEAGDGGHEGAEGFCSRFSEPGLFEGKVDEMVYYSDRRGGLG